MPVQIMHPITKSTTSFWFEDPTLSKPVREDISPNTDPRLFPRECREAVRQLLSKEVPRPAHTRPTGVPDLLFPLLLPPTPQGTTYKGPFSVKVCWSAGDGTSGSFVKR